MSENVNITQLPFADSMKNTDTMVVISNGKARRFLYSNFSETLSDWNNISNKPFDIYDEQYFITTPKDNGSIQLQLSSSVSNKLHTHDNKSVIDLFSVSEDKLFWNGNSVSNDYELPIATSDNLGGVKVDGNTITIDENGTIHGATTYELPTASNTVLGGVKVDGTSIVIDANGIISANTQGLDFEALTTVLTTGIQSGIKITADTDNKRFDFEVTGIPIVAIDSEGYWTIDGERGENPTKAQGEKGADGTNGKDGASPTIDPNTKNWIVGTVDTGVKAEAQSNYFYTGTEFPTSDLIDGDLFLSFADDTRGNVYQYQETTLDWSLQGNLYGGGAVIDDTSTVGNTVTWSANKINSVLGDINTILISVTGGIE